jgi:AcrR family transcriptional regulator
MKLARQRGRPREFNRDQALERAMLLFWAQGYEGTSLAELQRVMGDISAPSFYAAFGSKERLFHEAVALYNATQGAPMVNALANASTARAAIEALLRAAVRSFCQPGTPRGCFVVLGAVNCTSANKTVETFMRHQRDVRESVIRARLKRGVTEGDVPPTADLRALAAFYSTVVNGMSVQARDGASRKVLNAIVDSAMAAWDAMLFSVSDTQAVTLGV